MSINLSSLVSQLQSDVPARDGVPSTTQYTQSVKDAVADFSRQAPMQRVVTLNMISGTAIYDLPSDFVKAVRVASLTNPSGVIIADQGIIPVSADYNERWMVAGRKITFYPTPTYSIARDVWYAAGHVLDSGDAYPDLTGEDAAIVMLKARAIALTLKGNVAADNAWDYAIGDERVSKVRLSEQLFARAADLDAQYLVSVHAKIGVVGARSDYDWTGH
jgi:hypothetical protein